MRSLFRQGALLIATLALLSVLANPRAYAQRVSDAQGAKSNAATISEVSPPNDWEWLSLPAVGRPTGKVPATLAREPGARQPRATSPIGNGVFSRQAATQTQSPVVTVPGGGGSAFPTRSTVIPAAHPATTQQMQTNEVAQDNRAHYGIHPVLPGSVNAAINTRYAAMLQDQSRSRGSNGNREGAEQSAAQQMVGAQRDGSDNTGTPQNGKGPVYSNPTYSNGNPGSKGNATKLDAADVLPPSLFEAQSTPQGPISESQRNRSPGTLTPLPQPTARNQLQQMFNTLDPSGVLPPSLGNPSVTHGGVGGNNLQPARGTLRAPKYSGQPEFIPTAGLPVVSDELVPTRATPYDPNAFLPTPLSPIWTDPSLEGDVYRGKFPVPVQRPWVEWFRPLYTGGIYPPAKEWFGRYNLTMPHFMVYGDFRTGLAVNRNALGDANNLAFRLNLDMDLEITATERIHAFIGPLDRAGDFTRFDFTDSFTFVDRTDLRLDTLFFEGDLGAIWGGISDQDAPFDLPFTLGLIPFFYQNGVWAADAAVGAAFAIPSRHSALLNWANYDATFFWASDQVTTDAFKGDNNAAEFFGTAWFIDAMDGFFEVDYAFVHDDVGGHRSYHNFSIAFTRRYFHKVSNSIRFVTNFDQSLPSDQRTADGHLLLIENALITATPNTLVPYANFFYGQGVTQSLARAGIAGGILNNTGINFETDGLTGYPTLDATGVNTVGGAIGVNMLGYNFNHQLILELAALSANGSQQFRNAPGDQYALGMRYQKPLNNAWLFRTDHMFGILRGADDIRGSRVELRWKF